MTRKTRRQNPGRPREPGRRAREDVTLQLQLPILTPQPDEFVTLGRRQAQISTRWLGFPPALAAVGLRDPVTDSLRGGLELAGQIIRITTGADQLDHLAAELGRVWRTGLGIGKHLTRKRSRCPPNRGNPSSVAPRPCRAGPDGRRTVRRRRP